MPVSWGNQTLTPVWRHPEVMAWLLLDRRVTLLWIARFVSATPCRYPIAQTRVLEAGRVARLCDGPPRRGCRMERQTTMRPACPPRPPSSPACPSDSERVQNGSHGQACTGASSPGAPVRDGAHRCRPGRGVALAARGSPRPRGPARARGPLDPAHGADRLLGVPAPGARTRRRPRLDRGPQGWRARGVAADGTRQRAPGARKPYRPKAPTATDAPTATAIAPRTSPPTRRRRHGRGDGNALRRIM
jgi:hypothetical protein